MMNDSHNCSGITRVFYGKILGIEVKHYSRFGSARVQLGVQHLVDRPQARIGSVSALPASCEGQQSEDPKREEAGEGWE
jgi:hypothetical protein